MRRKMKRLKWQLKTQKFLNEVFGTVYKKVRGPGLMKREPSTL